MKKFNLFKMLAVLIVLITSLTTQVWAGYNWYGNVFFRAPDNWDLNTYSHVQIGLVQKTDVTTNGYIWYSGDMSRVGNTRLFYLYMGVDHSSFSDEWVIFTANTSTYGTTGDGGMKINANGQYTTPVSYGFSNNNYPYLYNPSSEDNGASVSGSCNGSDDDGKDYNARRTALLNVAQHIYLYTDGSNSKTGGSVNISGEYVSGNTSTTSGNLTNTDNDVSYNCAIGSTVTLTATPAAGYAFMGWYNAASGGTRESGNISYSYTCKGEKTLYARFVPAFPTGKTYYLVTNAKWREGGARFAAVFFNGESEQWVNCSVVDGTSNEVYSVNVPADNATSGGWGGVVFCKMNPSGPNDWEEANKWCQTNDMSLDGIKNAVYINGDCDKNERWGKYAPVPAIVGDMNDWDPAADPFTDGELILSDLSENSAYKFKVAIGRDDAWYGYGGSDNTLTYVGQTTAIPLTPSTGYNMLIMTAGTGDYTFTWDSNDHTLKVDFPTVGHPSTDYVYVKPYSDWSPVNAHLYGGTQSTVWTYDPALSSVTIYGNTYYYTSLGYSDKIIFGQGVNDEHKTKSLGEGDQASDAPTLHKGKYYDASGSYEGWAWTDFSTTLALDHQGATNTPVPNNIIVTFNKTTNLTGTVVSTLPTKTGYPTFGGYYTQKGGEGDQLITSAGAVNASVAGYTSSGKWIKTSEESSTPVYAKWTQTVTLDKNGDKNEFKSDGSITATYNGSESKLGTLTSPVRAGYTVEGYYAEPSCKNKVLTDEGAFAATDVADDESVDFIKDGKWVHSGATTLYTKWTPTHFVIYRPGDKSGDSRTTTDAVETYAGGTTDKPIEFRMKVSSAGQWYSLCIPFTVTDVQVWDPEDKLYYPLTPYYRSGDKFYLGHYVLRTPAKTEDFEVENFWNWVDPTSFYAKPKQYAPYIIMWPDTYFYDKYVSFFGDAQTIDTSLDGEVTAPEADNVVNVYGNNTMHDVSVDTGAYLFESDYGNGAWLRSESESPTVTVAPFDCFILASSGTTASLAVLRRDMPTNLENVCTPTGESVKILIDGQLYILRGDKMYTIQGALVKYIRLI